jgi:hypothetical protein
MMKSIWVRWTVRIGLGVLAVIAALAGLAALLFGPRNALLLATILAEPLLNNTRPPEIVAGHIRDGIASDDLNTFFRQKFLVGTDETIVRATLLQQGFKRPDHPGLACRPRDGDPCPAYDLSRTLEYAWGHFPCGDQVVVWWTASDHGAITDIGGYHHFACV